MEWGPEPSVRWKPPLRVVCGTWERERGDSLSLTGKKKRIAHRVSVDQPSLCAVVFNQQLQGGAKKMGGVLFVGYWYYLLVHTSARRDGAPTS